jgi:hypothetical protein
MPTEKTDVVIVGAGPVGGIVAAELSKIRSLACSNIDGDPLDRSRYAGKTARLASNFQDHVPLWKQNTNSRGVLAVGGGRHFQNRVMRERSVLDDEPPFCTMHARDRSSSATG